MGTPSARAANANEGKKMDGIFTDAKHIEKNNFRTSDSSDFGSHSQNMVVPEAPAIESRPNAALGGVEGESVPHEEEGTAMQLATSIISSMVTKCISLSDNSDAAPSPFVQSKMEDKDEEVPHSAPRKRGPRKKAAKVPVVASINRRKRTTTRSDTDAEMTSAEATDEKPATPSALAGPCLQSKRVYKKRG